MAAVSVGSGLLTRISTLPGEGMREWTRMCAGGAEVGPTRRPATMPSGAAAARAEGASRGGCDNEGDKKDGRGGGRDVYVCSRGSGGGGAAAVGALCTHWP